MAVGSWSLLEHSQILSLLIHPSGPHQAPTLHPNLSFICSWGTETFNCQKQIDMTTNDMQPKRLAHILYSK